MREKKTLNHILNGCETALRDGRYTYIFNSLDMQGEFTCHVDIEGCQTQAGGKLPPSLVVSTLRPDIVIIDKNKLGIQVELISVSQKFFRSASLKIQGRTECGKGT